MLKYIGSEVVFREIPDEISLAINITNCPIHCPDCHSKKLWEDIGDELTWDELDGLIKENPGITCVLFMGGDADLEEVARLALAIKESHPLKVALYSGNQLSKLKKKLHRKLALFDYIKTGPFIKERGPLNVKTTNQRLYETNWPLWNWNILKNITNKFWNEHKTTIA